MRSDFKAAASRAVKHPAPWEKRDALLPTRHPILEPPSLGTHIPQDHGLEVSRFRPLSTPMPNIEVGTTQPGPLKVADRVW